MATPRTQLVRNETAKQRVRRLIAEGALRRSHIRDELTTKNVSGLQVTIDVLEHVTGDVTTVVADPDLTKFISLSVVVDLTDPATPKPLRIVAREKTDGLFVPFVTNDERLLDHIALYSVEPGGSTLEELSIGRRTTPSN